MSVPESCCVLVVGGGPAGSYAASALAREGVDVVVLEAEKFPRYHIGESMLASMRHFLRFIDLEKTFDSYGFTRKVRNGAAFKFNNKRPGYTDFLSVNGPNGFSWNVIRSESDKLMLDHAEKSGAHTFQGVKVESIQFVPAPDFPEHPTVSNPGRAVSATWCRKADGATGAIKFDYLVDASGRNGVMSTRYLKNRKFNKALKNVAHWGYWKGAKPYAPGTPEEGSPVSEALTDQSGWCWAIPLHDGTMSVGTVMLQDRSAARKREMDSPSTLEFYKDCLTLAPEIHSRLDEAELVSPNIKAGADWSYSATEYAGPNFRVVGDAGCFIDPYFSSGVHLALAGGLSAAMTIQASRNGECSEFQAAKWHSSKVAESYSRFLLVVMTAMRQIRSGEEPVLNDFDEDGFDRAMGFFRPIIQGIADADVGGKLTQGFVTKSVEFCLHAFDHIAPEDRAAVLEKLDSVKGDTNRPESTEDLRKLNEDELVMLRTIRARQILRTEDMMNIENFSHEGVDGYAPRLIRGSLGLARMASQDAAPAYSEGLFDAIPDMDATVTNINSTVGPEGPVLVGETKA
ncbi:tryptophan 2-halogenase [Staphylotrichum tortipilum]|uniref:Tryptophan 2-halogenase n=1 Tax=Staphylotrichum tortipilum TaxID=2831512 RepID=A0AAN6MSX0_9PEZI|nr:tryptophan 2-halogenase [Staphylotrichum longicolle]